MDLKVIFTNKIDTQILDNFFYENLLKHIKDLHSKEQINKEEKEMINCRECTCFETSKPKNLTTSKGENTNENCSNLCKIFK